MRFWKKNHNSQDENLPESYDVDEGKNRNVDVTLMRIANLRKEGWFCGDLHVHRAPSDMKLLMQAEDLDFAPVITWWNSRSVWQNQSIPAETTVKFDKHRIYTVMAGEDEREGGALLYFGLKQPLPLPDRRKSPEHLRR